MSACVRCGGFLGTSYYGYRVRQEARVWVWVWETLRYREKDLGLLEKKRGMRSEACCFEEERGRTSMGLEGQRRKKGTTYSERTRSEKGELRRAFVRKRKPRDLKEKWVGNGDLPHLLSSPFSRGLDSPQAHHFYQDPWSIQPLVARIASVN